MYSLYTVYTALELRRFDLSGRLSFHNNFNKKEGKQDAMRFLPLSTTSAVFQRTILKLHSKFD